MNDYDVQTSAAELVRTFKALGEPVRLQILRLLPLTDEKCDDVYNVSELAEELGLAQPTVSHHLCVLKNAGLVKCRKMCRDKYYWVDCEALSTAMAAFDRLMEERA